MDRIKRLSGEILEKHKSKFGEDFTDNKKALAQVSIIRSKGLKNEIAGFITKLIKKERRDREIQEEIIANQAEITGQAETGELNDEQSLEADSDINQEAVKETTE